jgi:uncharacterized membrane protein YqgA involved in biofilm formation
MLKKLPMRGTILNVITVVIGSLLGLWLGQSLSSDLLTVARNGIGLVCFAMGLKMVFESKSFLIVVGAIVLGGIIGVLIGIQPALDAAAEWTRQRLGGQGRFNEGLITATVLFCIGPMTILGCIQDGLERKIELLAFKSTLDGVAAIFLAATIGSGVLASAIFVLLIQGSITLAARLLKPLADRPGLVREASAAGGVILMSIALGLLQISTISSAAYLPALVLAPLAAHFFLKEPTVEPVP